MIANPLNIKLLYRYVNLTPNKFLRHFVSQSIIKVPGVIVSQIKSKLQAFSVSPNTCKLLKKGVNLKLTISVSLSHYSFKTLGKSVSLRTLKPLGEFVEVVKWIN
jgi:hypothetical protein